MPMNVIPAVDLLGGKCVRLVQGEYNKNIEYADDPVEKAKEFLDVGLRWLHIIDLDGARIGRPVNTDVIEKILQLGGIKVQIGGGLRDEPAVQQALDLGVSRAIIGTQAVKDFDWFAQIAKDFPGKIVLSLDARGSKVATHGWTQESPKQLMDFAQDAAHLPLAAIIYTDITKDGMLDGPNFDRIKELAEHIETPLIAAGGVTHIEDVVKLNDLGVLEGAIVGRALYEGTMNLKDAIKAIQ